MRTDRSGETPHLGSSDGSEVPEHSGPPGRWRLLAPAAVAWGAAAWLVSNPGVSQGMAIVGAALTVACALILWFARTGEESYRGVARRTLLLIALPAALSCAALLLMSARVLTFEAVRADPAIAAHAERGKTLETEATLRGFPESRAGRSDGGGWVRATLDGAAGKVPVMLWLPADEVTPTHWAPGTRVALTGRLTSRPPGDPAAYSVRVLTITDDVPQSAAATLGGVAANVRHALTGIAAAVPAARLVPGFAVGDTSLVTEELRQAMLESSLTHLVAVSGSNTGLVIAAVVWLGSRLGAGRRTRVVIAATALGLFVLVVGPDVSVQRAALMAAVMLVSSFGGKQAVALPALGLAALVLLVSDPWQAVQPGFALSVAATAGILLLATPVAKWLKKRARLPTPIALACALAITAQLACSPLLLLLEPGIPVIGVVANVIAAPLAPLGTGLGLIAALFAPMMPTVAHAVVVLASVPAMLVETTAFFSAAVPFGRWAWPGGWLGALLFTACLLMLMSSWLIATGRVSVPGLGRVPRRMPWRAAPLAPVALRSLVSVLTAASVTTIIAVVLVQPVLRHHVVPDGWAIVACDVGQGDALLLRDPSRPHEVMLVDTGDDPAALRDCLDRFGVGRITWLVLSHDDRDHVGALPAVLARTDTALVAPTSRGQAEGDRQPLRELRAAGVHTILGAAGMQHGDSTGLWWQVLAPEAGTTPSTTNDASLVLRVQVGAHSVLLLGDTGEEAQRALLRETGGVGAEVLKVAHHGSRDQHHPLIEQLRGQWALVSVGTDNRYGHPAHDTLAALHRSGMRILRTDVHGSIALIPATDGSLYPWVEHVDARNVIRTP